MHASVAKLKPVILFLTLGQKRGPAPEQARHAYWFGPFAECSFTLDIDNDGKVDIAAGRNYYLAPNCTKHSDYHDGAPNNFERLLRGFVRGEYVGLQDHDSPVSRRNVRSNPQNIAVSLTARTITGA